MPTPDPIILNLNGYTDVPAGKVVSVVTYLEMHETPASWAPTGLGRYELERLGDDLDRYRSLFGRIGNPWLWFGRAIQSDSTVSALLRHPQLESYALRENGTDIGLMELDFREADEVELAYFGLVPGITGKGIGKILMDEAIRRAFEGPIKRFTVHTCSMDHPRAVSFYIKSGFRPYRQGIEIVDDPRLTGFVPLTAAPQVPIYR